ncbi:MAG TPA: CDP-glucose 4,6-dehydratase [Roseimicrobium sp.]|nr:CDP-glucose 4,6-dehydratase [Roseimicrobium sp.]
MMSDWQSIYRGKRVLVTGDTGFKGSWLCLWLLSLGATVKGYSLAPKTDEDHFKLLKLGDHIQHVDGDVRDLAAMRRCFDDFKPEIVIHLAAQALVRASYDDPKYTFDVNVSGGTNLLEAVRHCPSIRSVVFITSDKAYLNQEWVWGYRESDTLGGHDPYSASKAAAELVFSAYVDSFFKKQRPDLGIATARAGNVIGGGDWAANRIIPDCIRSLRANQPITLRFPASTRPWQHVLEPLSGYLLLGARLYETPSKFGGAWNFGPSTSAVYSVQNLTEQVVKNWGSGSVVCKPDPNQPHEAGLLQLNCDKAHAHLHWRPRWNFERTVVETVDWYRQFVSGTDIFQFGQQQINRYTATT